MYKNPFLILEPKIKKEDLPNPPTWKIINVEIAGTTPMIQRSWFPYPYNVQRIRKGVKWYQWIKLNKQNKTLW